GQVEVRGEGHAYLAVRPGLEHEGVRLVLPGDAVVVEHACEVALGGIGEAWGHSGAFRVSSGSDGAGLDPGSGISYDAASDARDSSVRDRPPVRPALRVAVLRREPVAAGDHGDQRAGARRRRLLRRPDDVRLQAGISPGPR